MLEITKKALHWATNAILFVVVGFMVGGIAGVGAEMVLGVWGALFTFFTVGTASGIAFVLGVNSGVASLYRRFTSGPRVRVRRTRGA